MDYNTSGISLREGKAFIDGLEVLDLVKCEIKITPEVWSGKQVGEQTDSTRWLGYKVTGVITRRRSTKWLKEITKKYQASRKTPELTIQGIQSDPNSEYYENYGSDVTTAVGCVLTGDLSLTALDSKGDILDDVISFNAKDVV